MWICSQIFLYWTVSFRVFLWACDLQKALNTLHAFGFGSLASFCWTPFANLKLIKRRVKADETLINPQDNSMYRALKPLFSVLCKGVRDQIINDRAKLSYLHPSSQHRQHDPALGWPISGQLLKARNRKFISIRHQLCNPRT